MKTLSFVVKMLTNELHCYRSIFQFTSTLFLFARERKRCFAAFLWFLSSAFSFQVGYMFLFDMKCFYNPMQSNVK